MRILTETSFIYLSSSSKNKYLFFLKTNLSDLVHCLSDNDRLLLRETAQWSQTQKNHLLMLIAGSEEALKFRIHEEFSVQDVIESVLGWRQDALPLCDRLPNTPTKPYDPISVPKWMHRKTKGAPSSRALLEYRYNARRILRDAKEDMGLMLKRANDFCKTTHLRKSEWINFDKENTSHYLNRQDIKTSDKSWLMHGLKRYKPLLFNKVRQGNLKEMREIERYELQSIKEKNEAQDKLRIADKNAAKALRFLSSLRSISGKDNPREYAHIKRILRKQLFHEDPDLSFKQMNLLYLTYKEKPIVSKDDWKSLQAILMELYAEKFFSIYHFPINSYEGAQIQYFMFRYSLTNEIPVLKEFLMFLKIFNQSEPDSFSISLVEKNQEIQLQYTFGQDTLESINDHHQDGTFLAYACRYGLGCMIHCLLDCGATADSNDLVEAFYSGVLTQDLAVRLLARGADAVQCFSDLAEEGDLEDIRKLTALLGIEKRDEAIASLSKESHSQHLADILTKSGFPDEADQGPVLHVFRKS